MPAPEAGRLRSRVELQRQVEVRDATYASVERTWEPWAFVWAAVEPLNGREWLNRGQPQADISTRIRIRWRAGVTADMRVVYGTRIFEIDSVIDPESRREELVLMCREQLNG